MWESHINYPLFRSRRFCVRFVDMVFSFYFYSILFQLASSTSKSIKFFCISCFQFLLGVRLCFYVVRVSARVPLFIWSSACFSFIFTFHFIFNSTIASSFYLFFAFNLLCAIFTVNSITSNSLCFSFFHSFATLVFCCCRFLWISKRVQYALETVSGCSPFFPILVPFTVPYSLFFLSFALFYYFYLLRNIQFQ